MLDDLRNSSSFIDDDEPQEQQEQVVRSPVRRRKKEPTFLGLTAKQRFFVSLMLFFLVCVVLFIALVLTGNVVIPS